VKRVWLSERRLPLESGGKSLFVSVTGDGLEIRRLGDRHPIRAGWFPLVRFAVQKKFSVEVQHGS
jgi:hypothetical protein